MNGVTGSNVLSLAWMEKDGSLDPHTRKLLGFTDNRQDAALQAGHFNDFIFVTLLRGAILRAVRAAGSQGLKPDKFGEAVLREQAERMDAPDQRPHGRKALALRRSSTTSRHRSTRGGAGSARATKWIGRKRASRGGRSRTF